jgi:hypothetical protein
MLKRVELVASCGIVGRYRCVGMQCARTSIPCSLMLPQRTLALRSDSIELESVAATFLEMYCLKSRTPSLYDCWVKQRPEAMLVLLLGISRASTSERMSAARHLKIVHSIVRSVFKFGFRGSKWTIGDDLGPKGGCVLRHPRIDTM